MTIHELIEKSGFSRRTIYFYTQMELLPPPKGKGKTYEYSEEHLKRLQMIKKLQAMRYSLKEIRELLSRTDFSLEDVQFETISYEAMPPISHDQKEKLYDASKKSADLWKRYSLGTEAELHIKWPPSQDVLEELEHQIKVLIQTIKGELR